MREGIERSGSTPFLTTSTTVTGSDCGGSGIYTSEEERVLAEELQEYAQELGEVMSVAKRPEGP